MSNKTAGTGHFLIPTAPAAGTSCTSGAANVFTTAYVQLIASTAAALYITGIYVEAAAVSAATYKVLQLATGAAASETIIGQYLFAPETGSATTLTYRPIYPFIPVATTTRISCKTADSVGAQANLITLECIAQSNVVNDGITVGTVNLVNTATTVTNQLTAAAVAAGVWRDTVAADFTQASSVGISVMNGVALGIGLKINSYTGDTPQSGDNFARLGAAGAGLTALGDTRIANLDAVVSSRLAAVSYSIPPSAAAITTAVLTTPMTESYAIMHAAPTLAQIHFEKRALLAEKAVAGTVLTVNKIDGTTVAETFTLNDATAPTAITRAT